MENQGKDNKIIECDIALLSSDEQLSVGMILIDQQEQLNNDDENSDEHDAWSYQ